MAKYWTFRDYVAPDGENLIHTWLNQLRPKQAKARINTRLLYFEALERLNEPHAKTLEGECAGLLELRIKAEVQYRLLSCYGPGRGEVTILYGAIERGDRFEPTSACSIALARKAQYEERGRTREHRFD